MDFWYLLISRRATVPGLYLWGFLTPPVAGADFLAALVASCFLGAFPPVDLRAVCLVRAMASVQMILMRLTLRLPLIFPPPPGQGAPLPPQARAFRTTSLAASFECKVLYQSADRAWGTRGGELLLAGTGDKIPAHRR